MKNLSSLEKQLNRGIKAALFKQKQDSSDNLKIKYKFVPVKYMIEMRMITYFWKLFHNNLPAFANLKFPTLKYSINKRTETLSFLIRPKTKFIDKCFSKLAINAWNNLPESIKSQDISMKTMKNRLKSFMFNKFLRNPNARSKARHWKDFKFSR